MINVIRLMSGVELLGTIVKHDEACVVVNNPLEVTYFTKQNGTPSVSLQRYMPFASDAELTFNVSQIESVGNPIDGLQEYYEDALLTIQKHIDPSLVADLRGMKSPRNGETSYDSYLAMIERVMGKKPLN